MLYLFHELRLGDKIKVTGEPLRTLKWSMAVREGDKELLSLLNEGIRKVRQSGEYERIYTKWFGKKILAGYSQKEIWVFSLIAVLLSLAFGISIGLFILNMRLRSSRNELSKTITEHKRSEKSLRESEERYRILYDNIPTMNFTLDTSGNVVSLNQFAVRELGYQPEELVGRPVLDIFYDEDKPALLKQFGEVLQNPGRAYEWEFRKVHKDGRIVWVREIACTTKDQKGDIVVLVACQDITERKKSEEALRKSEARLKEAQQIAHLGHWELDLVENTLYWSDEVYRIFDLEPQEFGATYEAFLEHVHPDDRDFVNRAYTESVRNRTGYDIGHRVLLKNGEVKYVRERCQTEYDDRGNPLRSIGTVLDITQLKLAEEALRKLNEELEMRVRGRTAELKEKAEELEQANIRLKELDRLKSMFIASMSHELRTPLNSIIGFSSILLNEWLGSLTAEQKENLSIILRSGKHLLNLIDDVIDVSKVEAGIVETRIEDFDIYDVISEAVTTFTKDIKEKGLELKVEMVHQQMHTDRRRLLQCVLNLISNAVKFTGKGSITVQTLIREPERIDVEEGETSIEISVTDTGIGIEEENIPKLFNAFVRLESPLKAKVPGTGLGLYLTKKLVTGVLKGEIICVSRHAEGSTFTMKVPVRIE
ncbi:MAG: PAS domain-containing protein [Nitrospirae bacterium]|nr:PAS domain-containing protein [Nitrospirota bacterium]